MVWVVQLEQLSLAIGTHLIITLSYGSHGIKTICCPTSLSSTMTGFLGMCFSTGNSFTSVTGAFFSCRWSKLNRLHIPANKFSNTSKMNTHNWCCEFCLIDYTSFFSTMFCSGSGLMSVFILRKCRGQKYCGSG